MRRRRRRASGQILQAAHEINDVEGPVQGLARESVHGHALVGLHGVADCDRRLEGGHPALVLARVHEHIGVATGIHGFEYLATDHAGRYGSRQSGALRGRLIGGFGAAREGQQQAQRQCGERELKRH